MSENSQDRIPEDRTRITLNESYEFQYWSKESGCTTDELWDAVTTAVEMVKNVAKYLNKPGLASTIAD